MSESTSLAPEAGPSAMSGPVDPAASLSAVARMWESYTHSRSPKTREQLLVAYLPLVRRVAGRVIVALPRSVRMDDLMSAGVLGLLSSVDNFDPELGIKFETFAVSRIRGAMMDSLRELDWVPRSVRQTARRLDRVAEGLTQRLGRVPGPNEVADALQMSIENYRRLLRQASAAVLVSLDDALTSEFGDSITLAGLAAEAESLSSHERLEELECRIIVTRCLKALPPQEKLVLALYYYEELTLKEIGEVLSLTESRVSQIHAKAVATLRVQVNDALNR